jgi:hypothetical protein
MPASIHTVTPEGFIIKLVAFIRALAAIYLPNV